MTINDPSNYAHDRSPYERPMLPYRCGRGSLWVKPCHRGPSAAGGCGGTAECRPFKKGDRWECRRPKGAGGECSDGPQPNGHCSQAHPPCKPVLTLRRWRGRLARLAALLVVVAIAASFRPGLDGETAENSLSPGHLTGAHARFTAEQGCTSCHAAHKADPRLWLATAVGVGPSLTDACLSCHSFGGAKGKPNNYFGRMPHNTEFKKAAIKPESQNLAPDCTGCHTEHRGEQGRITAIAAGQCNACHEVKVTAFHRDHPKFNERYPHESRGVINFDHGRHLALHFQDARHAPKAPKDCITCHEVSSARRRVSAKPFEATCAGCHGDQIAARPLTVLNLPELEQTVAPDAVKAACGLDPDEVKRMEAALAQARAAMRAGAAAPVDQAAPKPGPSVSLDPLAEIPAYLLAIVPDDQAAYAAPVSELLLSVAQQGVGPMAALLKQRFPRADPKQLLAGMSPDLVKAVACAWLGNREYASMGTDGVGWVAEGTAIKYKPAGHADPVARSWMEAALAAAAEQTDADQAARGAAVGKLATDTKSGFGACAKCHGVQARAAGGPGDPVHAVAAKALGSPAKLEIQWNYIAKQARVHVKYNHVPHLNLLEKGSGCATCHKINDKAEYAAGFASLGPSGYVSNFMAISIDTCRSCHQSGGVRSDCAMCHLYHRELGFVEAMQRGLPTAESKQ